MIPPLLYAIPRLLLFVIPIFIKVKEKEKRDDPVEEPTAGGKPTGEDPK